MPVNLRVPLLLKSFCTQLQGLQQLIPPPPPPTLGMCVCTFTCVYASVCTHVCMHKCTFMHAHMHVCVCVRYLQHTWSINTETPSQPDSAFSPCLIHNLYRNLYVTVSKKETKPQSLPLIVTMFISSTWKVMHVTTKNIYCNGENKQTAKKKEWKTKETWSTAGWSDLVVTAIIKEKTGCYTTYESVDKDLTPPPIPPKKKEEEKSSCCSAQNDWLAATGATTVYLQDKHFPLTCWSRQDCSKYTDWANPR